MKQTASFWLLLACCTIPALVGMLVGLSLHLPGSGILWQTSCSGITGGGLFLLTHRRWYRSDSRQHAAIEALRTAIQREQPTPPLIDEERDRWGTDWNTMAREICNAVNQLRLAHRTLDEHRNLLETVLGTMSEGVLVLDGERCVLFCNGAARQLLDARHREVLGRPLWEITRSQPLLDYLQQPLPVGSEFRQPIELTRQNVLLDVTASPFHLGAAIGMVIVMHDVTELRRLERSRRDFFNSVSHELKTPLTSIRCFAETLLDGGLEDLENNRGMVVQIETRADKLNDLIQDILRLARIEARFEKFELAPVRVTQVIRESVTDRQPVARARQVHVELVVDGQECTILGDASGLRSIVDNLINNAINYNRPNGNVRVGWSQQRGGVEIFVTDTGIGISQEDREHIFERFYRVDKARSATTGGTGLGLAIVKHLTAVFNGRIEVESELGQGSTFRVWFPLLDPLEVTETTAASMSFNVEQHHSPTDS